MVNEIGEDGKVVHLTSLQYGGRGKQQQAGAGDDQKTETETEKQEKKDEGESTKQSEQEKAPPTAPVKEFEVPRALSDMPNM